MKRLLLALSLALASPALAQDAPPPIPAPAPAPEPRAWTSITAGLTLQVDDRAKALDAAIALAEANGGWFAELGTDRVSLRVPTSQARAVVEELRGSGDLVHRTFASNDLTAQAVDLESRLKARREVLARYEAVLDEASPKAIVSVERQITQAVAEIERLEGQLRVLRDRADHARIDVSLKFRERRAPTRDGSSSFAWLNTMNVADMLRHFEWGHRATRSKATVPTPDGFAAWRKRGRFQAVSPDEVLFRVRTARNKPRADLGYWREALRNRMSDAGYKVLAESDISASGHPGVLLELGAANGEQDQTYLVAVFVSGRKLVIAEATAEATRMRTRKDALLTAISGMQIR